jgi:hypothetical protein
MLYNKAFALYELYFFGPFKKVLKFASLKQVFKD